MSPQAAVTAFGLALLSLGADWPLAVVDDVGRTVHLTAEPRRIVSTAPSNTAALIALGVGPRLVGVTRYCDQPEAAGVEKIGDFSTVDLERIVALEPDLVVGTWLEQERYVERMEKLGLEVLVLYPTSIADTLRSLVTLGQSVGRAEQAETLVDGLRNRIAAVTALVGKRAPERRPRVFVQLSASPLYTAGPGSTVDEAIALAGGRNIAADLGKPYASISRELVIAHDPEVIIVGSMVGDDADTVSALAGQPGFAELSAVRLGRVHAVDPALLFHQNHRLIEGVEVLSRLFATAPAETATERSTERR